MPPSAIMARLMATQWLLLFPSKTQRFPGRNPASLIFFLASFIQVNNWKFVTVYNSLSSTSWRIGFSVDLERLHKILLRKFIIFSVNSQSLKTYQLYLNLNFHWGLGFWEAFLLIGAQIFQLTELNFC